MKKTLLLIIFLTSGIWFSNAQEADYIYDAQIVDVYDGDTVTALVDLGFHVYTNQKLRLYGIDTPEIRGKERAEGLLSRDIVREAILNKKVVIKTAKDKQGKYGRYLATIFVDMDQDDILDDLNQWLVDNGYAEKYKFK